MLAIALESGDGKHRPGIRRWQASPWNPAMASIALEPGDGKHRPGISNRAYLYA